MLERVLDRRKPAEGEADEVDRVETEVVPHGLQVLGEEGDRVLAIFSEAVRASAPAVVEIDDRRLRSASRENQGW